MNPGSVFGSGFGQAPAVSPFSATGLTTPSATGFGANTTASSISSFSVFGSASTTASSTSSFSVFGSANTGMVGSGSGFSSTPAFGSVSGSVFGSPAGTGTSSSSSTQGGFGGGAVFGSRGTNVPGFGAGTGVGSAGSTAAVSDARAGTVSTAAQFAPGSGFGTSSTVAAPVFNTASTVFGTASREASDKGTHFGTGAGGTRGFGVGSTAFGTSSTGITSVSTTIGGSGIGATGGMSRSSAGSSVFRTSTAGSVSNPGFGTTATGSGSSVFGSLTGAHNSFGTGSVSQAQGQGTSVFGSSVFGRPASSSGGMSAFSPVPVSSGVSPASRTSVFGAAHTATTSVFGAGERTNVGSSNTSPSGPPPSYSAAISSGQRRFFAPSSTASVFGGAGNTSRQQAETNVFGGAGSSVRQQAEGSVFGGAGSSVRQQAETSVFGGAGSSVRQQAETSVFGGAGSSVRQQAEGSVFGGAGSSVKQQGTSQPAAPSTNLFGRSQTQTDTSSSFPPALAPGSVFGGRSEASSIFGGRQQKAGDNKPQHQCFGGVQEKGLTPSPLFPAATAMLDSRRPGSGHQAETFGALGGSGTGRGLHTEDVNPADSDGGTSLFGGKTGQSQKRSARGEEGSPGKPKIRRSSSVLEDVSTKTSISCHGIGVELNKGSVLRRHFSRFGTVKMVRTAPQKESATIQFETHEAAARAKKDGTKLPGQHAPLTILWKSSDRSPGATRRTTHAARTWTSGARAESDDHGTAGHSDPLPSLPNSVAAELASMSGADSDITTSTPYSALGRNYRSLPRPATADALPRESGGAAWKKPEQRSRNKTPPPAVSSAMPVTRDSSPTRSASATVSVATLRKMVATTTMDKVNVLDARDKLLRQKLAKQASGGVHAKAFVGTCPDMCPEKERLDREEFRRLTVYEIIPGSSTATGSTSLVDHSKAVKEYSRSSADQDEPLPHELRPLPVLTQTMNYLLTAIADCGEDGKWAEWYDFLWNRTRSIRKEITQQQLCSQGVVDLLEKCVRFHVYCGERLCSEDMMVFDSKINNENLTKCLQTLKELYADMDNRHGLHCPNEAEFRAYIVLMNLNQGDTLREVQQLREEVRGSAAIGFAVKAYIALNSNNYVRFFRLVRSASFLNACILHRYFNQMRARALQIILRSHTAGQKKVGFPLSVLQRLLMFESDAEIREFCSYYGLRAQGLDLLLDRSAFVEPETSIPLWRAVGLVESKRTALVGEVINGGPLEPVILPAPQCSFDQHGRFIGSLDGLVDNEEGEAQVAPFTVGTVAKRPQLQPSPLQDPDPEDGVSSVPTGSETVNAPSETADTRQPARANNEVLKTIARDLFFEVIDEHARSIAEAVVRAKEIFHLCEGDIMAEVTSDVVTDIAREVSREAIAGETARQQQLAAAEKREREMRITEDLLDSIVSDCVKDEAQSIALQEIQRAREEEEEERRERVTLLVQSEVLQEVSAHLVLEVSSEVHEVDVVARLQLLADLQKAVELRRTSQWLAVWRQALKVRQRQKRAMLDFPCAPPLQGARQRLQDMYPDCPQGTSPLVPDKAALYLNHRAKMTVLSPYEAEKQSLAVTAHLSLASLVTSLQRARAWDPVNLATVLTAPLSQAVQQWPRHLMTDREVSVQWKLLLSLPGELETETDDQARDSDRESSQQSTPLSTPHLLMPVLKDWLVAKFTHGDTGAASASDSCQKRVLSQYSLQLTNSCAQPSRLRVGVCVRHVPEFGRAGKKNQPSKEHGLSITKGTSAILFLLPHATTSDDTLWLAARLRLAQLVEAKPVPPPTPLVLLLPCQPGTTDHPPSSRQVCDRLGVSVLQEQGVVSCVGVVELPIRSSVPPDVVITAPALHSQVVEAIKFLASNSPPPPDLKRDRLADVVENMLTQHFFTAVLQDLKHRQRVNKLHQGPNTMIGLYNSVLDHIGLALTSPALQEISWPAPELQHSAATAHDWNSKKHLGDVYELVSSLRLPWFHYGDRGASEWSDVCCDVWTFVDSVVKKRCDSAVSLTSRISRLLAQTCVQFENMCSLTHNEDLCTPTYVNAPWTDLVLACIDFRLQRLHNWKEEEEEVGGDLEVLYEEEELEGFEPPASWLQAVRDSEDPERERVEATLEQASVVHFANQPAAQDDFTASLTGGLTLSTHAERGGRDVTTHTTSPPQAALHSRSELPENLRSAFEVSETLRLRVGEERQKAEAFERYLQKALNEDSCVDMDLSSSVSPRVTAGVVRTPGLSPFTPIIPARPPSAVRHRPQDLLLSTPHNIGLRPGRLSLGSSLEPRRLTLHTEVGVEEGERGESRWSAGLPLSDSVDRLKEDMQAQRYANQLFEKRLHSLLES